MAHSTITLCTEEGNPPFPSSPVNWNEAILVDLSARGG